MSNPLYENKNFYLATAHLFYAIAMADKNISREEKIKIIGIVKKYWSKKVSHVENNALMYATLRTLICKNTESQKAFLEFSEHYYKNRAYYDLNLKEQLSNMSNIIATTKVKRSKLELILLTKLHSLFFPKDPNFSLKNNFNNY